jgi:DNA polymerase-3 subunit gamma/tau
MSDSDETTERTTPETEKPGAAGRQDYVVVARRYRPQTFEELIGQQHVAQAISGAITAGRVGHAYLFTGARGVGKTSAARIFAKALNCETGPAPVPCNQCDICSVISSGDDVDVLEIDGASNRGIDEIRQLRQNVSVRPSRSRFKIYIIDEVHMLTREAFNALLKTLEEPPAHVKFIFCTTEPNKIPITILSRCQRFDFAGIMTESIGRRLQQIVKAEGIDAEPQAIEVLARRAAGSMRDGQSLLEQLLAFVTEKITIGDVHSMLGTAGDERLLRLTGHLAQRDAASALAELDSALAEGVDIAQLLEQLSGYLRDCMVAAVGCSADAFHHASPDSSEQVADIAKRLGLSTVLASMQIIDQTLSRLRQSTQIRPLAELALVRICQLEDLDAIGDLIGQLQSGQALPSSGGSAVGPAASSSTHRPVAGKKNVDSAGNHATAGQGTSQSEQSPQASAPPRKLNAENATEIWSEALARMSGMTVEQARQYDKAEFSEPNRLVITFKPGYALAKSVCERPDQLAKFVDALAEVTGERLSLEFRISEPSGGEPRPTQPNRDESPQQKLIEAAKHPMVHRAGELFGARPMRVDNPPKRE